MNTNLVERKEISQVKRDIKKRLLQSLDNIIGPDEPNDGKESLSDTSNYFPVTESEGYESITSRQEKLLVDLINTRISDRNERNRWLEQLSSLSKGDASEMISSFLIGAGK